MIGKIRISLNFLGKRSSGALFMSASTDWGFVHQLNNCLRSTVCRGVCWGFESESVRPCVRKDVLQLSAVDSASTTWLCAPER